MAEASDLDFSCPNCAQQLVVEASLAGTQIRCPGCGQTIAVPALRPVAVPPILAQAPRDQPQKEATRWKKILGPFAVVLVLLSKVKGFALPLLKFFPILLKTGGTMLFTIWVYAQSMGWPFALGFVVLIFVHECGHLIAARRLGLKVGAPVFIPFMGAFIALKDAPRNAWIEAQVGIGGPLLGSLGGAVCWGLSYLHPSPLLVALAYSAFFLNLFNLAPIGFLDGGRIATALSPWLWLVGLVIVGALLYIHPNFLLGLILLFSLPRVFSLFRKRTPEEERYFEVTPKQRLLMGSMYLGLIVALFFAMHEIHP